MQEIETKDGIILRNIPDGVSDDQIKARIALERAKIAEQSAPKGSHMPKAVTEVNPYDLIQSKTYSELTGDMAAGRRGVEQTKGLMIGKAAGDLWEYVGDQVGRLTPDFIKAFLKEELSSFGYLMDTKPGKELIRAVKKGAAAVDEFQRNNPEFASQVNAAMNVASVLPAAGISRSRGTWEINSNWLDEVVTPYMNKAEKLKRVERTSTNKLGVHKYELSKEQKQVKEVLKEVPGIKPVTIFHSNQMNYEAVHKELVKTGDSLIQKLEMRQTPVSRSEVLKNINKGFTERIKEKPSLKNKAGKFKEAIEDAKVIIEKYPKTSAGLLRARKEIDAQFRLFKGDRRAAGLNLPSDDEIAWRTIRDSVNRLLDVKEPGYKRDITKQRLLFEAEDIIKTKALNERATPLGRGMDKLKDAYPDIPQRLKPR